MREQRPGRLALVHDERRAPVELGAEVGQIRIARPDHGDEVQVLVVEAHDEYVQGMLCGEECDLATDTDSILQPDVTGLPRRILVHGDVSGSILKRRLGRSLGQRLGPNLVERIALRGRGLDFTSTDLGRGRAIAGESDPRWEWKLEKHRQMRPLRARASELGWEIYKLGPREE
ncbi:MAG TPA: hypothetical protein VJ741_18700 [Solirubrobacteraceae bacterium]|nr:hypothetical protein [Solirubrobacteraceae bacterium]